MNFLFLDIDGVLATYSQYNTYRKSDWYDDPVNNLKIPYPWDHKCVTILNRIINENNLNIVISSDWKLHYSLNQLELIFKIMGVAKPPIGLTRNIGNRCDEILDWINMNKISNWIAIDDLDLSKLGEGFILTNERFGIAQAGLYEKITELCKIRLK